MFKALATRIKALFFTNAALDVEAEFLSRSAERKAQLLDEANHYEKEGKTELAKQLQERAGGIDFNRPLAVVLPSVEHLREQNDSERPSVPLLENGKEKPVLPALESSVTEQPTSPKDSKKSKVRKK